MTFLLMMLALALSFLAGYVLGARVERGALEAFIGICLVLGASLTAAAVILIRERK